MHNIQLHFLWLNTLWSLNIVEKNRETFVCFTVCGCLAKAVLLPREIKWICAQTLHVRTCWDESDKWKLTDTPNMSMQHLCGLNWALNFQSLFRNNRKMHSMKILMINHRLDHQKGFFVNDYFIWFQKIKNICYVSLLMSLLVITVVAITKLDYDRFEFN